MQFKQTKKPRIQTLYLIISQQFTEDIGHSFLGVFFSFSSLAHPDRSPHHSFIFLFDLKKKKFETPLESSLPFLG